MVRSLHDMSSTHLEREEARLNGRASSEKEPGSDLLSQEVYLQVPSARVGLTAVFGMGTGVTPPPWLPGPVSSRAATGENSIASTNVSLK